jgi:hypothetical protein
MREAQAAIASRTYEAFARTFMAAAGGDAGTSERTKIDVV